MQGDLCFFILTWSPFLSYNIIAAKKDLIQGKNEDKVCKEIELKIRDSDFHSVSGEKNKKFFFVLLAPVNFNVKKLLFVFPKKTPKEMFRIFD